MRTLFLHAWEDVKVKLPEKEIAKLPKKLCLLTVIQFHDQIKSIQKALEKAGKKVLIPQTTHTFLQGHILGCNVEELKGDFEAFLYIGDGLFHPKALLMRNQKPVFAFNPLTSQFFEVDKKEVEAIQKKKKQALNAFYHAKEVGILITTKIGQARLPDAIKLKEKFKDKNFYFLLDNTIDFSKLEDFNFIQCFVNTACPRLGYDDTVRTHRPLVEIDEILLQDRMY
ncbi:MAG TPA: diphthamide synthesis protein [Candidatus Nanoarchaeia archaeon]|nr:diphthamide synthesis protein [Candidatus Nanoarchaeia archaeon]